MNVDNKNGYAIILALVATALISCALVVLMDTSTSLLFDSNQEHVQAWSRNLSASALAWAQLNRDRQRKPDPDRKTELDVEHLSIPAGRLHIIWLQPSDQLARVSIETECRRGKLAVKRSDSYFLISRH